MGNEENNKDKNWEKIKKIQQYRVRTENTLRSEDKQVFENPNWLKTFEAAEYLRVTPDIIRKWVYQGKLKGYKLFSKSLRFKRSELDLLFK